MRTLALLCLLASSGQDEMIENPEFKTLSSLKPGSWMKFSLAMDMGMMKVNGETTRKIISVSEEKIVTEESTAVEMGGRRMPPTVVKRDVLPKTKKGEFCNGDSTFQIKAEGEEELEVAGKKLKCKWMEVEGEFKGDARNPVKGKAKGKVWLSPEVMGGMAKTRFEVSSDRGSMSVVSTFLEGKAAE